MQQFFCPFHSHVADDYMGYYVSPSFYLIITTITVFKFFPLTKNNKKALLSETDISGETELQLGFKRQLYLACVNLASALPAPTNGGSTAIQYHTKLEAFSLLFKSHQYNLPVVFERVKSFQETRLLETLSVTFLTQFGLRYAERGRRTGFL